jgi:long-chain acyl-CoA synthetase
MDQTIPRLLLARADATPEATAYWWKEADEWRSRRWRDSFAQVAQAARALADLGVERGSPVAILSETRPEWAALDLATLSLRGITVGVYPSLTAEQVAFQLAHSEARIVFVENAAQAAKIAAVRSELPQLRHVIAITPVPGLPSLEELRPAGDHTAWLRQRALEALPDDVATYIYTSGTTGNPKAAVLTHRNFWEVAHASRAVAKVRPGDRSVVFLPLAHSLQRFTVYRGLLEQIEGVYAESIDKLPEALVFARATILASVPRMLEKIREKADAQAASRGGVAKRIYDWAFRVGAARAATLETGAPLDAWTGLQLRLADRLVFSKVKAKLGGELRVIVSGGAALDPHVARWYLAMGIPVLEGWGLTETSAPATANREDRFKVGTIGPPLPGVEVRVDADGELLVRGPGVFQGYLKDPEATAAAFTDGWFRTGDIGTIDADGFVRITDRKKEILVTAGGKNIPPVNLEKRLERSRYVSQAVVIGDARPYLTALLAPEPEALAAFARERGWPDEPLAARLARPEVRALYDAGVAEANASVAKFEQIKKYALLDSPFTVESGELTPTLKLKRRVIAERRKAEIEALYA